MDKNLMEFWGNFLLNAAKSQKQVEDVNRWMKGGFGGFEEMTAMFKKACGMDTVLEKTPDYLDYSKKASETFLNTFKESMGLMSMVPKEEHLNLIRKYEALKEKSETQEETIRHLRMLLGERDTEQKEITLKFQELAKGQGEKFQDLVRNLGSFYKSGGQSEAEEKSE